MPRNIPQLVIGGESYPFVWGTNAFAILKDEKGLSIEEVMKNATAKGSPSEKLTNMRTILYAAIRAGYLSMGSDTTITEYQVGDLLDELLKEEGGMDKLTTMLSDSLPDAKKKTVTERIAAKKVKVKTAT